VADKTPDALYIELHQCQAARGTSLFQRVHVHLLHRFAKYLPGAGDSGASYRWHARL